MTQGPGRVLTPGTAGAVAAALLAVSQLFHALPLTLRDDAYITFRYAENLLAGLGFVYNAGERVLGTTTPLYTLLLAAGGLTGVAVPWVSVALETGAAGLVGWLIALHFRACGLPWMGPLVTLALATVSRHWLQAAAGMETMAYVAALLGAAVALQWRRHDLAVLAAAAAVLLRPDGILILGPLVIGLVLEWRVWWPARRRVLAAVAAAAAGGLAWLVFSLAWFGGVVPQSVVAKAIGFGLVPEWTMRRMMWHHLSWRPDGVSDAVLLVWPGLFLMLAHSVRTWPLLLWFALYTGAMSLGPASFFPWYLVPVMAVAYVAAGHTLAAVWLWWGRRSPRLALLLAGGLAAVALRADLRATILIPGDAEPRFAAYRALGRWMAVHTPSGARIAAQEIGLTGYHSRRHVTDASALITPSALRHLGRDTYTDTLIRSLPDFGVAAEVALHWQTMGMGRHLPAFFVERARWPWEGSGGDRSTRLLERVDWAAARFSAGVVTGDFDGNGWLDAASGVGVSPEPLRAVRLHMDIARAAPSHPLGLPGQASFTALACGDFDGDGLDDLALGSPDGGGESEPLSGEVWIIRGQRDSRRPAFDSTPIRFAGPHSAHGWSLAAGDFDGDGFGDLAAGAPRAMSPDRTRWQAGAVAVLWGSREGLVSGAVRTLLVGPADNALTGWALAAGDFDGDGLDDLLIGSRGGRGETGMPPGIGEAIILRGDAALRGQVIDLADLGRRDTVGLAAALPRDSMGASAAMGDIDGDGRADALIGAPTAPAHPSGTAGPGRVSVLFGAGDLWGPGGTAAMASARWTQIVGPPGARWCGFRLAARPAERDAPPSLVVASVAASSEQCDLHLVGVSGAPDARLTEIGNAPPLPVPLPGAGLREAWQWALTCADADGDGGTDLILALGGRDELAVVPLTR